MSIEKIFKKTPYQELRDQFDLYGLYRADDYELTRILYNLDMSQAQNKAVLGVFDAHPTEKAQDIISGLIAHYCENTDRNSAIIAKLREAQKQCAPEVNEAAQKKIDAAINITNQDTHKDTVSWLNSIKSSNLDAEIEIHRKAISNYAYCASYSDDYEVRNREANEARAMSDGLALVEGILSGTGKKFQPAAELVSSDKSHTAYREMLLKHFPVIQEYHKEILDTNIKEHHLLRSVSSNFFLNAKEALLCIGGSDVTEIKRNLMNHKNNLLEELKGFKTLPGHLRASHQQFIKDAYQKILKILTVADHEYSSALGQLPRRPVSTYSLG